MMRRKGEKEEKVRTQEYMMRRHRVLPVFLQSKKISKQKHRYKIRLIIKLNKNRIEHKRKEGRQRRKAVQTIIFALIWWSPAKPARGWPKSCKMDVLN